MTTISSINLWGFRVGIFPIVAFVFFFSSVCQETSYGKRLSKVELRKLGFAGSYRGVVSGSTNTWNGVNYTLFPVNQARVEPVPTPSTVLITAPTGTNAFFLSYFPATGSERRVRIRSSYTGVSFNSFYGANMIGSGGKTLTIRKKGKSNPRYAMAFSDSLTERAQVGGAILTFWRIGGSLSKR